jgi:hypothetical protein
MEDSLATVLTASGVGCGTSNYVAPLSWLAGNPDWGIESLLNANDQINLINKLRDKMRGSDFNPAVFTAEGFQAADMIYDAAVRIAKSFRYLKHGNFQAAAGVLVRNTPRERYKHQSPTPTTKDLGSRWLELQYGWLPLLKDAEAGAHMLAHHLNTPLRQTYRATVKKERNVAPKTTTHILGVACGNKEVFKAVGRATKTHRRTLIAYVVEREPIPKLLGLMDPELVLWELMPYSFVVDWFIPIGDWLAARAFSSKLVGTFVTCDKRMGVRHQPDILFGGYKNDPLSDCTFRVVSYNRSVSSVLPCPLPTFKPLGKAGSFGHVLNAIGLVAVVFGRHPPPRKGPTVFD